MAVHHHAPPTPWGRTVDRCGDLAIAFCGLIRRLALGVLLGLGTAALIIAIITAHTRAPGFIAGGALILTGVGIPLWRLLDPPPTTTTRKEPS